MNRPRLLDLFCGVGGAAWGYHLAGFDVVGVDIQKQKRYPFPFFQADALELLAHPERFPEFDYPHDYFDAIHASPPCQAYADEAHRYRTNHPDLIEPTRDLLEQTGLPWVIENVDTAPLRNPMMLCGTMFEGVRVIRHRMFESSFYMEGPPHPRGKHPPVFSYDKRRDRSGLSEWDDYVTVTGGGNCSIDAARDAMGIRWATIRELNQAIPPAYTKYVGERLLRELNSRAAA